MISVYRTLPHQPVVEESPLWMAILMTTPGRVRGIRTRMGLKVGCEIAAREAFGDERLLIVRPHVVLGPHEYVGRIPWHQRRGGIRNEYKHAA